MVVSGNALNFVLAPFDCLLLTEVAHHSLVFTSLLSL